MADAANGSRNKRRRQYRPENVVIDEELEAEIEESKKGGYAKTTEKGLKVVAERWATFVSAVEPGRSGDLKQAPIGKKDEKLVRAFLVSIKLQGFSVVTVRSYHNFLSILSKRAGNEHLAKMFPELLKTVCSHLLRKYGQTTNIKKKALSPDDMRHLCAAVGLRAPSAILDCTIMMLACVTGKRRSSVTVDEELGFEGVFLRDVKFLWPDGAPADMISFTLTINHEKTVLNKVCQSEVTVTSLSEFFTPWNLPLLVLFWLEVGDCLQAGTVKEALERRDLRIKPSALDRALLVGVDIDENVTLVPMRNLQNSVQRAAMKAGYSPYEVTHRSGRVSLLNNSMRRHYDENGAQVAGDAGAEAKLTAMWTADSRVAERDYRRNDKHGDTSGAVMGESAERRVEVSAANLVTRWRERLPDEEVVWTAEQLREQAPEAFAERLDNNECFQTVVQECETKMNESTKMSEKRDLFKTIRASYMGATKKALLDEVHGRVCAQRERFVGRGHPHAGKFEASAVPPVVPADVTAAVAESRATAKAKRATKNVDAYWYALKARFAHYLNEPGEGEESPEKSGSGMRLFRTTCGKCAPCLREDVCGSCATCVKEGVMYTNAWKARFCTAMICELHVGKLADKHNQKKRRQNGRRSEERKRKREERDAARTPEQRRKNALVRARRQEKKEAAAAAAVESEAETDEDGDEALSAGANENDSADSDDDVESSKQRKTMAVAPAHKQQRKGKAAKTQAQMPATSSSRVLRQRYPTTPRKFIDDSDFSDE